MNNKNRNYRDQMYDDNYTEDYYPQHDPSYNINENQSQYEAYNRSMSQNNGRRRKKKKSFKKKFGIFLLILAVLIGILFLITWYVASTLPDKTNFLIMATDEDGTRTDTIMVGCFDKSDKSISMISLPRDTYVTVSDEMYKQMRAEYPQPASKSMKLNAVHHFAGEKNAIQFTQTKIEELLGIKIDYYVKINFKAFRYIIDNVGGIDFEVPQDMKYDDPTQNLHIDLKKGMQHLDGEKAEQVVRYRSGYANADLGRISVQQDFVKAFAAQVLSKKSITSHPMTYINTIFKYKYIKTNAGFFDTLAYAITIRGIDTKQFSTETLPGAPTYKGGQSVYLMNDKKAAALIDKVFFDN